MLDQLNEEKEEKDKPWHHFHYIIKKTSRTKLYWDAFTNFFYIINFITVPYNIAFGLPDVEH